MATGQPRLVCELGLIDEFLKLPHHKVKTLTGPVGAEHLSWSISASTNALQIYRSDAAMGFFEFPS
jgi:hypothetical protein